MVEILQRARLLPLRQKPSARGIPTLPERSQFNRLVRFHAAAIEEIALHLAQMIEGERCLYQALDASAMAGLPDGPTSAGPTAWDGTRVSLCSLRSIPQG